MKKCLILSLALIISLVGLQSCDRAPPPPRSLDENGNPLPPQIPPPPSLDDNERPTPPSPAAR